MISLRTGSKCTFETVCCLCQNHLARIFGDKGKYEVECLADYNDLTPMVLAIISFLAIPQDCE